MGRSTRKNGRVGAQELRRADGLRILAGDTLVRANATPAVSAITPPTISQGAGETYGNGIANFVTVSWTDPRFRYNFGRVVDSAVVTADGRQSSAMPKVSYRSTLQNFGSANVFRVEFLWTGTMLAFGTLTNTALWRMWVDGQPLSSVPVALTYVANNDRQVRIDFGTRARRLIVIEGESTLRFRGLALEPTAILQAPPNRLGPKVAWLTDSYGEGQGPSTKSQGYVTAASWLCGWGATDYTECVGSTGFTANSGGAGGRVTYADPNRLASVVAGNPDIVVVQGSRNDNPNVGTGAITPATVTVLSTIRAALPNAWIIVTGPLYMETPPGSATTNQNEVRAGYDAVFGNPGTFDANQRVAFIDTITPMIGGGTGNIGTRTVTDGVLNSTTQFDSATAAFVAGDVGSYITATGIPAGTKIASRTSATRVVLSAAATVTASGVTTIVTNQKGDGPADYVFAADVTHPSAEGHELLARWFAARISSLVTAA